MVVVLLLLWHAEVCALVSMGMMKARHLDNNVVSGDFGLCRELRFHCW